ncbi:unnamed protein product [Protopolystoma xenopodis]|uniref:AMP-dependent synthetase/ligase domain-containing protein n=1 Tax=Protopolystoma xenopodis TaxID=117903 RepID=A0A3S5A9B2_9PLAT|nr:unnamed protein product [Protopolystoma xenopodis]
MLPTTTPELQFLPDILAWRAAHTPDDRLFTVFNAKAQEASVLTCVQLHRKAERIAGLLLDKTKLTVGQVVALLYPPGKFILLN